MKQTGCLHQCPGTVSGCCDVVFAKVLGFTSYALTYVHIWNFQQSFTYQDSMNPGRNSMSPLQLHYYLTIHLLWCNSPTFISDRLTRECTKTTQFDGFTVPAGAIVELPIYMLHRNPKYWPNPEKFDPER